MNVRTTVSEPDDHDRGLYDKYKVTRVDGKNKGPYFVLAPLSDPHAVPALRAYIASCHKGYPKLAGDLAAWLDPNRDELIALCRHGVVLQMNWRDRDSAKAQRQLAECRALLEAGCQYSVLHGNENKAHPESHLVTDQDTIWLRITYRGFNSFEEGEIVDTQTFYVPSRSKLERSNGQDWY